MLSAGRASRSLSPAPVASWWGAKDRAQRGAAGAHGAGRPELGDLTVLHRPASSCFDINRNGLSCFGHGSAESLIRKQASVVRKCPESCRVGERLSDWAHSFCDGVSLKVS